MKLFIVIGGIGFSGFLIIIGFRMEPTTLALAVGFFLGVAAGIPGSLLMLAAQRRGEKMERQPQALQHPGIIVLGGHPAQVPYVDSEVVQPSLKMLPSRKREVNHVEW